MWSGVAPPPESHTPYLVSVGLVDAETTDLPPSLPTLQPRAAQQESGTPEVHPQHASERSVPQSPLPGPTALAPGQQQVEAVRSISSTSPGSSAQELIHSHELARAGAAHRADVQALQAHQAARETQLQAWCAAQLQSQLAELEQGREILLSAAAEAQVKRAAPTLTPTPTPTPTLTLTLPLTLPLPLPLTLTLSLTLTLTRPRARPTQRSGRPRRSMSTRRSWLAYGRSSGSRPTACGGCLSWRARGWPRRGARCSRYREIVEIC